jgi:DNA-binding CsgD family transcriptional regulator
MRTVEVVGRDRELGSVRGFLDRAADGPAALILEGAPGIGKSTVWLAGVEDARSRSFRVLVARPTEAEHGLAHVGLADLLEGWLDDVLPRLPAPRRRALAGALLVDEAPDAVDPRAVGIAVRDALQVLAEQRPAVVAVDDLQWLDVASSDALAFALRRLDTVPVVLLIARRAGRAGQRSELEGALPETAVERLRLGPLSVGALHAFLRGRVGRVLARQTLLRIHEQSGGNPFYALEIARSLGPQIDPTQPLPVPDSLYDLVQERLSGLPPVTRAALAMAAAVGTPTESLLTRAGIAPRALEPALAAGVIALEHGTVRFTHPLLASAVYDPSVHGRLSEVVEDPLARARHLALSTDLPDAQVARALDDAARRATERGAAALAAELSEHALRLTPAADGESQHRRALATARAHRAAGEWTRAQAIARELLASAQPGADRAEVLLLLAGFEVDAAAVPLLEAALTDAAARADLQLCIRIRLAECRRFTSGFAAAYADACGALTDAEKLGDQALRVSALSSAAFLGRALLTPEALAYAAQVRAIATRSGDPELLKEAATLGLVLTDRGEYEAARAAFESDHEYWRDRDERVIAMVLWGLAWLELWTGDFERAAGFAHRSHELSIQYGVEAHSAPLPGAWTAAYRGRLDVARELAQRGLALCHEQIHIAGPLFPGVLGLVASWGGDAATGVTKFAEADRLALALDWRNPHMRPWTPDYVEALLELGRIGEAQRVLGRWEADVVAFGRPRLLAQVVRCRGLVAAADGQVDEAASLLERAVEEHEQAGDRFGRGRALLALGVTRRRQRQKAAARRALEQAGGVLTDLGAETWAERTRAELGRIGGRTREKGLTPAQRRVAALVAEGRTNREVAAALFLGERTVETHLSGVYAKLGVRSRAELARVFRADSDAADQK